MTDLIEKRKKRERLEIAERKVDKAWLRASKLSKKLKRAKKINDPETKHELKEQIQDAFKRLKRNKKELHKFEKKVS